MHIRTHRRTTEHTGIHYFHKEKLNDEKLSCNAVLSQGLAEKRRSHPVIDAKRFTVNVCVCVLIWGWYLGEMMLSGESQAIDSVCSTVRPLAKLL